MASAVRVLVKLIAGFVDRRRGFFKQGMKIVVEREGVAVIGIDFTGGDDWRFEGSGRRKPAETQGRAVRP